jgi:hypothetical protein
MLGQGFNPCPNANEAEKKDSRASKMKPGCLFYHDPISMCHSRPDATDKWVDSQPAPDHLRRAR